MAPRQYCVIYADVQVVAIANDITYSSGSFGPKEDAVFKAVTEAALEWRLPLIYLAANSGARVGLATEVKACMQVPGYYTVHTICPHAVPMQYTCSTPQDAFPLPLPSCQGCAPNVLNAAHC